MVDPNDIIIDSAKLNMNNICISQDSEIAKNNVCIENAKYFISEICFLKEDNEFIYLESRRKIENGITEISEFKISKDTVGKIISTATVEGLTPDAPTATEDDTCYSLLMSEIKDSLSMDGIEMVILNNYDKHLWKLAITSKNLEENKDKIKEISKGRKILSKKIRSTDCSISIYLAERNNYNDRYY